MPRDIVYFDLETKRTVNDVGGWHNKHEMGMSIGVTYSTKLREYRIYTEDTVPALIEQLRRADLIVGYNHVQFDYGVLLGYSVFDFTEHLNSFDIMIELEKKVGHRPKLEAVAHATLGEGKTADGLDAIRWWQQATKAKANGNHDEWSAKLCNIAHYCCHDVKATLKVHEHGLQHGHVKYVDRNQREQLINVEWAV